MKTVTAERREVEKQASVEEEVNKKEALERYNLGFNMTHSVLCQTFLEVNIFNVCFNF